MQALGIHVFAGGFTQGVRRVADVQAQLEIHDFGGQTVEQMRIPFINEARWEDWPRMSADFVFGNPRCTAFSALTGGYGAHSHGPCGRQTADIWDLCRYSVKNEIGVVIWESVQQAFTVGRPLLDRLRDEIFENYRIAHVFVNAASFGNSQNRKRYFFVAYRDGNFNVTPPALPPYVSLLGDVLRPPYARGNEKDLEESQYDENSYTRLCAHEKAMVPRMLPGEDLHGLANRDESLLEPNLLESWHCRISNLPFSLHGITRLRLDRRAPTLHDSCSRFIHPVLDRPLTVGELAAIMGWEFIPRGPKPHAQIPKGVVPDVGEWLARQVQLHLDGWGKEDYTLRYDDARGRWDGEHLAGRPREKVIDLTRYAPKEVRVEASQKES